MATYRSIQTEIFSGCLPHLLVRDGSYLDSTAEDEDAHRVSDWTPWHQDSSFNAAKSAQSLFQRWQNTQS